MKQAMDLARHNLERGTILLALKEDFGRAAMTSIHTLLGALDLLGYPLSPDQLEFHLRFLSKAGYISTTMAKDLPTWRADRPNAGRADAILFASLEPTGLGLIDGLIPSNPQVTFGD